MAAAIWVVTDGLAGNERQALALARALAAIATGDSLAAEPRLWRLHASAPWRPLAPRCLPGSERAFGEEFRAALAQPPAWAVGCGRQGALATRLLRQAGARVVQILDPRIDPRHWDALVVPAHDRVRGANVITVQGSLHDVDAAWLARSRARFPALAQLPRPRIALLLGGPIRNAPVDASWWRHTAQALRGLHARVGGSVSVCASRRTPGWLIQAACDEGADGLTVAGQGIPGVRWFAAGDGANPYAGLLAWADVLVVSPDSVNMLSEACASGAQVAIAQPQIARGRHAAFLASLMACHAAVALDPARPLAATTALHELPRVAALVRERLGV